MRATTRNFISHMSRGSRARARHCRRLETQLVLPATLVLEATASAAIAPTHIRGRRLSVAGRGTHADDGAPD